MPSNEQWTAQHVKRLQARSTLSQDQQLFMELAGKTDRSKHEEKLFKDVLAMEKAAVALEKAKAKAQLTKGAIKKEARKARDHELYNSAGLLIMAGLVDTKTGLPIIDKAELLGALMGLAKVPADDNRRAEWKRAGKERFDQEATNNKKTVAEPA